DEENGKMYTIRRILNDTQGKEIKVTEYMTGGFGTNEYQKNMSNIYLGVDETNMKYEYLGRKITKDGNNAYVSIPDINTRINLSSNDASLEVEEGIAFSPVYHLRASKIIDGKDEFITCLTLQKEN
ncbi:MAG: hypothetical protein J6Y42_03555, partial [Bacilli bacterium]|nr:hypothetical protein [Bacilli bacterium]